MCRWADFESALEAAAAVNVRSASKLFGIFTNPSLLTSSTCQLLDANIAAQSNRGVMAKFTFELTANPCREVAPRLNCMAELEKLRRCS